jgi:putative component of toxin-antitoxin plasmid stabilization module
MELEEDLGRGNTMYFPREDVVMMIYNGCPLK